MHNQVPLNNIKVPSVSVPSSKTGTSPLLHSKVAKPQDKNPSDKGQISDKSSTSENGTPDQRSLPLIFTSSRPSEQLNAGASTPRTHSLFDLETDKLLQQNQTSVPESEDEDAVDDQQTVAQDWSQVHSGENENQNEQKYKISGSFVGDEPGNKSSSVQNTPIPSPSNRTLLFSKRRLPKTETFYDEDVVNFDDSHLNINSSLRNFKKGSSLKTETKRLISAPTSSGQNPSPNHPILNISNSSERQQEKSEYPQDVAVTQTPNQKVGAPGISGGLGVSAANIDNGLGLSSGLVNTLGGLGPVNSFTQMQQLQKQFQLQGEQNSNSNSNGTMTATSPTIGPTQTPMTQAQAEHASRSLTNIIAVLQQQQMNLNNQASNSGNQINNGNQMNLNNMQSLNSMSNLMFKNNSLLEMQMNLNNANGVAKIPSFGNFMNNINAMNMNGINMNLPNLNSFGNGYLGVGMSNFNMNNLNMNAMGVPLAAGPNAHNIFGSFLSHGNSFSSILNPNNFNAMGSFRSNLSRATAENNFDIDHVKHIDENVNTMGMSIPQMMPHTNDDEDPEIGSGTLRINTTVNNSSNNASKKTSMKRKVSAAKLDSAKPSRIPARNDSEISHDQSISMPNSPRRLSTGSDRSRRRGKWSDREDNVLQELANAFLDREEKINFKKIADKLSGRTAKQCREHWLSTLNPDLKKGRWTKAEEIKLLDLMIAHGKSWSIIAKQIPGRAEHSVKAKGRLMLGERLKSVPQNAGEYLETGDQKQRLLALHKSLGSDYEDIGKQCGFIVSPAKIERTMLAMCDCQYCKDLTASIKATNCSNVLQGWTKIKALEMKRKLLKNGKNGLGTGVNLGLNVPPDPSSTGNPINFDVDEDDEENDNDESTLQPPKLENQNISKVKEPKVARFNSFSKLSVFKTGVPGLAPNSKPSTPK